MAKQSNLLEVLQFFKDKGEDGYIEAEHDQIWLNGPNSDLLSDDEIAWLDARGVHWDEDIERWTAFC